MASLADAEDALRSTSAKANFQRLTRLLMCGGLGLLRETFDSIHSPADFPLRLSDPAIQIQLRGARLTRVEWDCLYPSPGVYGKSTDFDITLIFRLLRTICNLAPPPGPRGWDDLPNSSDHSLEADLVRIKYYRNEVYGHSKTMEITDTEFDDLWRNISEALIRIAATISHARRDEWKKSIDEFLVNPLTPEEERCTQELKLWYKQDMDVKAEVEELKQELKRGHESTQEEVRHLREELKQFQRSAAILIVNTIESVTRAGSPVILNYPSGRPQIPHDAGEPQGICAIPVPDQERAEDVSDSGELQLNPLDTPTELHIWTVILSFKKAFELFLQYLGYKLNAFVRNHVVGSLLITVECSSLHILEGLWEDYCSGHLNEIAQEILVTAEVLEKLGLDEVKLKTFISEEEYEKCKQIFMDTSDPFEKRSDLKKEIIEMRGRVAATEKMLQDHIEAISNFEKENIELRERLEAMEQALEDKKESRNIDRLEKKNIQLEKRLVASESARERSYFELGQLKQKVDYLEECLIDQPSRGDPYYRRQWSMAQRRLYGASGPSFEGKKGFCQVIVNRQKLEVLVEEKEEFKSVFKDLGFYVDETVCESNDNVELVINSVARRDYSDYNSFVCFMQSSVTKDWEIESFYGRSLSLTKLLAKFSYSKFPSLVKIFIIQGHQTTTALEADEPLDVESFSVKLPMLGGNFLCLFVPYRKGYISTLLSVIKLHGSKQRDILYILSEAKKLFYEKNHITIPDPVHNLMGPVFLAQDV